LEKRKKNWFLTLTISISSLWDFDTPSAAIESAMFCRREHILYKGTVFYNLWDLGPPSAETETAILRRKEKLILFEKTYFKMKTIFVA
jgi:hypothetical protein